MAEMLSSNCRRFNHPELRLRFDPQRVLERDVRWLVARLEQHVAKGYLLADGLPQRFGWMFLNFCEAGQNLLAVQEPDMVSLPVKFVDSVTTTLQHFRWQSDTADSIGYAERMDFPAMFQTADVCSRLAKSEGFLMTRKAPSGFDSGWRIGCFDSAHDHSRSDQVRPVSLYEVVIRCHEQVAMFLALPPGIQVLATQQGIWISYEGKPVPIQTGSYLEDFCRRLRKAVVFTIDASGNLFGLPAGVKLPAYPIPVFEQLVLKLAEGYTIPVSNELKAMGIEVPNTIMVVTKDRRYCLPWTGTPMTVLDLAEYDRLTGQASRAGPAVQKGDEITLALGYMDREPNSITKGGIVLLWMTDLRVV
jgi:hypothetical protein